jgi:hypothetical protein
MPRVKFERPVPAWIDQSTYLARCLELWLSHVSIRPLRQYRAASRSEELPDRQRTRSAGRGPGPRSWASTSARHSARTRPISRTTRAYGLQSGRRELGGQGHSHCKRATTGRHESIPSLGDPLYEVDHHPGIRDWRPAGDRVSPNRARGPPGLGCRQDRRCIAGRTRAITCWARARSCLSRLPSRATRAHVVPRQGEIAAR